MAELLRKILIEAALHPFLTAVVLMLVSWPLLTVKPFQRGVRRLCHSHGRPIIVFLGGLVLLLYATVVIWYLFLPGFAGELEPMITSVSWLVQQGQPLYHDFDSAERYSVLYGPNGYLTDGLFMRILGPTLVSAKIGHVAAALASLLCLYLALTSAASHRMALGFTALAALLYWTEGSFSYMIRPDAYLLMGLSLALMCALRAQRTWAILWVALALGYCVNLKIHTGFFFLPILAILHRRFGLRAALTALGGGVVVFSLPFLLHPQVSLRNYIVWLREATRHGLNWQTFLTTFQLALFMSLPLVVFALPGFRAAGLARTQRTALVALTAGTAIVLVLAAKPGAGLNHLMPLIPLVLYFATELLVEFKRQASDWNRVFSGPRLGVALAIGSVALVAGTVTQYRCVRLIQSEVADGPAISQDVQRILDAYPEHSISMAYGGEGRDFRLTSYRPLLVFAGQPVLLDVIAVMEADFAGRSLPQQTYAAVQEGRIAIWLVPKQRPPFQKNNWYPDHNPIFPQDFQDLFLANFGIRDSSQFFDLWFHNSLAENIGWVLTGDRSVVLGEESSP